MTVPALSPGTQALVGLAAASCLLGTWVDRSMGSGQAPEAHSQTQHQAPNDLIWGTSLPPNHILAPGIQSYLLFAKLDEGGIDSGP